ncbi:hypothetical protein ACFGVS_10815 [Mucilaginibacter sp. AW1-7]|uniref:hypothetical protein n=1 Tax=Mucilaginibacter sp. AW1-7 TaxID=3349874 RepID=UPI003F741D53
MCRVQLVQTFFLTTHAEYSSQGGKKSGLQAFTTPDELAAMYPAGQAPLYLHANYNSEAKLNYLLLPILAKLGWDLKRSPLKFYVDAGPFLGLLVSAHQVTSGQSPFYVDAAVNSLCPADHNHLTTPRTSKIACINLMPASREISA